MFITGIYYEKKFLRVKVGINLVDMLENVHTCVCTIVCEHCIRVFIKFSMRAKRFAAFQVDIIIIREHNLCTVLG